MLPIFSPAYRLSTNQKPVSQLKTGFSTSTQAAIFLESIK
jgi:hypothetical protein